MSHYFGCSCPMCKEERAKLATREAKQSRTYEQGFRDGMSMDKKHPVTFQFMGYSMDQLIKLIIEHEERQPTKVGFLTDKYPNGLIIEVDGKPIYQK